MLPAKLTTGYNDPTTGIAVPALTDPQKTEVEKYGRGSFLAGFGIALGTMVLTTVPIGVVRARGNKHQDTNGKR